MPIIIDLTNVVPENQQEVIDNVIRNLPEWLLDKLEDPDTKAESDVPKMKPNGFTPEEEEDPARFILRHREGKRHYYPWNETEPKMAQVVSKKGVDLILSCTPCCEEIDVINVFTGEITKKYGCANDKRRHYSIHDKEDACIICWPIQGDTFNTLMTAQEVDAFLEGANVARSFIVTDQRTGATYPRTGQKKTGPRKRVVKSSAIKELCEAFGKKVKKSTFEYMCSMCGERIPEQSPYYNIFRKDIINSRICLRCTGEKK